VGDEILKEFADRIQNRLRGFDMVARLGGEEFVVLLPDVTEPMAYTVAERLRSAIADEPFECSAEGGKLEITTSVGGTIVQAGTRADAKEVLKQADDALYEAKEAGRNLSYFHEKGALNPDEHKPEPRLFID
jgi:two-component system cell cycle response regulator